MARFKVGKGVRVIVTSSTDAAYPQMFILEREKMDNPNLFEGIGNKYFNGGKTVPVAAVTEELWWEITGTHYNDIWRRSTESTPDFSITPPPFIIKYNDSYTHDNDFNDLIITVELIYPNESKTKLGQDDFTAFDETAAHGDGIFKTHFKKPLPQLDEDGKPIMEH